MRLEGTSTDIHRSGGNLRVDWTEDVVNFKLSHEGNEGVAGGSRLRDSEVCLPVRGKGVLTNPILGTLLESRQGDRTLTGGL